MSAATIDYISLQASSNPVEVVAGDEAPPATVALQAASLVLTAAFGFGANILVAVVFYRRPTLRSPSNRFVLSLVLANVLASLVVTPVVVAHLLQRQWWLRQAATGLTTLAVTAAVFSVLAIAVDRYHAVLSPLHYAMTVTRPRSRGMVAGTWVVAALLALPVLLGATDHACASTRMLALVHALVLAALGFALPLVSLCWIYSCMYKAAHLNSERTRRHSVSTNPGEVTVSRPGSLEMPLPPKSPLNPPPPRRRCSNASFSTLLFREEGRAVKTAAMVITSFLFCFTPYFNSVVMDAWNDRLLPDWARFLALLAALGSGCLTPFIYVFRNEAARVEALKVMLFWLRGGGQYGNNVSRDFETYNQSKTGNGTSALDQSVTLRRQSLSYCDSVSVQSFQISTKLAECRHCSVDPPPPPTADFVATYEVVDSPSDHALDSDAKSKEEKPTKTRRESVTFRLAFLPQRRCQTCIRQNSDSSSGSGHPLLKESDGGTPPAQKPMSHRRQRFLAARQSSSGDDVSGSEPGTPKHFSGSEFNNNHGQKKGGDSVILELDEPVRGRTVPRSPPIFQFQETSLERSASSDDADTTQDSETLRQDSGYSDATVDSGVVADLSISATTTPAHQVRRHRPKLQRLAAVEDEGDSTETDVAIDTTKHHKKERGSFRTRGHRPACVVSKCEV